MLSLKKAIAKRVLKKNVKQVENSVKRVYKDLSKRVSGMKMPVKVIISR